MKKVLFVLLTIVTVSAFAESLRWQSDFDEALKLAKAEKKSVFTFFTGSDWCPWCIRLNQEILSKKEMIRYLNDHFILFKADFPRKDPPPREVMIKNYRLIDRYGVEGYPTIIITDSAGKTRGVIGYVTGGPSQMIKILKQYE